MGLLERIFQFFGRGKHKGEVAAQPLSPQTWTLDPYHSRILWRVTHMGLVEVEGTFKEFEGNFTATPPHFQDIKGRVVIKTASIDSHQPIRDGHLRSKDFLDVENFPEIRFEIKKVVPKALNRFQIEGDLTIKGITKSVVLQGRLVNYTKGDALFQMPKAGFEVQGSIRRSDFGVVWEQEKQMKSLEGNAVLSDEVRIEALVEIAPPGIIEAYEKFFQQMQG